MASNNNRRKGITYERNVFNFFTAAGVKVEARNTSGHDGDDLGIHTNSASFSVEVKNHKKMSLAAWVTQAEENAGEGELPIVFHKRVGKGDPGAHYVTMSGASFVTLLGRLNDVRPEFTELELRKLLEVVEPRLIGALGLEPEPAASFLELDPEPNFVPEGEWG